MKQFHFARGMWDQEQLLPTFSVSCRDHVAVTQEDDAIYGGFNERLNDYDYIGLAMAEPVEGAHTIRASCSFLGAGAPLLVLADDVSVTEAGYRRFGPMYEIVTYAGGCNVWRILPDFDPADPTRGYTVRSIAKEAFPLPAGEKIEMVVRVTGDPGARRLAITVGGHSFEIDAPELPEQYVVGLTLCEGENRFYRLQVENNSGKRRYPVTLVTPEGEIETELDITCQEDDSEETVEIICSLAYNGQIYRGEGMDFFWVDAIADLQKQLPEGVRLQCCLACRHGNMCPVGNRRNEVFCTKDVEPKKIEDLYVYTEDAEERKKRSRSYFERCEHYAPQSREYLTYNEYLYDLEL